MNPTERRPDRRFVVKGLVAAGASLFINNGCLGMADRALRPRDPTPQSAAPIAPTPSPSPHTEVNPSPASDVDAVIQKAGAEAGLRINQKEIGLWDRVRQTTNQPMRNNDDLVLKKIAPTLEAMATSDIFGPSRKYFTNLGGKIGVVQQLPDNRVARIKEAFGNDQLLSIDLSLFAVSRLEPEQIALELAHQIAVLRRLETANSTTTQGEIFTLAGAETAEIYIAFQTALGRPPRGNNDSLKKMVIQYIACGKDAKSDCWQKNYRQLPTGPATKA